MLCAYWESIMQKKNTILLYLLYITIFETVQPIQKYSSILARCDLTYENIVIFFFPLLWNTWYFRRDQHRLSRFATRTTRTVRWKKNIQALDILRHRIPYASALFCCFAKWASLMLSLPAFCLLRVRFLPPVDAIYYFLYFNQ